MKKSIQQFRQGDVLLERIERGPIGKTNPILPEGGRYILRHGELTGHAHALVIDDVRSAVTDSGGDRWFDLADGAVEVHEDHTHIEFPQSGWHRQRLQREYSPEAIRNVAD
jgi:hypothetical protein